MLVIFLATSIFLFFHFHSFISYSIYLDSSLYSLWVPCSYFSNFEVYRMSTLFHQFINSFLRAFCVKAVRSYLVSLPYYHFPSISFFGDMFSLSPLVEIVYLNYICSAQYFSVIIYTIYL